MSPRHRRILENLIRHLETMGPQTESLTNAKEEVVDMGISVEDIKLVRNRMGCSMAQAKQLLLKHDGCVQDILRT